MNQTVITVWGWRDGILKSGLQPTTRLVLLTLSVHMNDLGEGCFPSTKTLEAETGLSERSVCTHLEVAENAGWLKKIRHGYAGKKWARHEYVAAFPAGFGLKQQATICSGDAAKEGTEGGSVPSSAGTEPGAEGTEPDDRKALKDVQCNSTGNSTDNSTSSSSTSAHVQEEDREDGGTTSGGAEAYRSSSEDEKARAQAIITWLDDFFRPIKPMYHGYVYAWVKWGYDLEHDVRPAAHHWREKNPHRQMGSYQWLEDIMALNHRARTRPRPEAESAAGVPVSISPPAQVPLDDLPEDARAVAEAFMAAHGAGTYRNWIGVLAFDGCSEGVACYRAPSRFIQQTVITNHLHVLKALWGAKRPEIYDVSISLNPPTQTTQEPA